MLPDGVGIITAAVRLSQGKAPDTDTLSSRHSRVPVSGWYNYRLIRRQQPLSVYCFSVVVADVLPTVNVFVHGPLSTISKQPLADHAVTARERVGHADD